MTWDHIATVVVATGYIAVAALVLWCIHGFSWRVRRAPGAPRGFRAAFAVCVIAACVFAAYTNMSVPSGEYPGLLDAYDAAHDEVRPAMRAVVKQASPRREIFSFSYYQRDRFLAAGGYCVFYLQRGCRLVPRGTEAEGLAINRFPYIASWGTSWPQEEPCHPRRCGSPGESPP